MSDQNILDSSAWIEILDAGPNTDHFRPVAENHPNLIVPTIVLTEIRKFILRERGETKADVVTRSLLAAQLVGLDRNTSILAADLGNQHKLPLADSIIYAITIEKNAILWTQDNDFEGLPQVCFYPKIKQ